MSLKMKSENMLCLVASGYQWRPTPTNQHLEKMPCEIEILSHSHHSHRYILNALKVFVAAALTSTDYYYYYAFPWLKVLVAGVLFKAFIPIGLSLLCCMDQNDQHPNNTHTQNFKTKETKSKVIMKEG